MALPMNTTIMTMIERATGQTFVPAKTKKSNKGLVIRSSAGNSRPAFEVYTKKP